MSELSNAKHVSLSAVRAQSIRLRVIAENLANMHSTGQTPGSDPYRRKLVVFENELDRARGAHLLQIKKIRDDRSDFIQKYEPTHPAANARGMVKYPNVNQLVEMMDMREARTSYEANMAAVKTAREMRSQFIGLLK